MSKISLTSRTRQLSVNVNVIGAAQCNGHFCWRRELASPAGIYGQYYGFFSDRKFLNQTYRNKLSFEDFLSK